MPWLNQTLLIVHVLATFFWFGATASLPGRIREALGNQGPGTEAVLKAIAGRAPRILLAGLLAIATGVAMAFTVYGGFKGLPVRFHASLGLSLIWFGLGAFGVRPKLVALASTVRGTTMGQDADPLRKKIAMFTGMQHLLFFVIVVLMVWKY